MSMIKNLVARNNNDMRIICDQNNNKYQQIK